MQTPPLMILSGWYSQTKLHPVISSKLANVVESKYASDKYRKSFM